MGMTTPEAVVGLLGANGQLGLPSKTFLKIRDASPLGECLPRIHEAQLCVKPCMAAAAVACNNSTWETEAEGSEVKGHPGLHKEPELHETLLVPQNKTP